MESPSSKPKTPIKQLPTKLGKNIKRQFRRISDHFHHHEHVTPTLASFPAITTTIISPAFPPLKHSRSDFSSLSSSDRMSLHSSLDSHLSHKVPSPAVTPDDQLSTPPGTDSHSSPSAAVTESTYLIANPPSVQAQEPSTAPDIESTRPIDTDVPDPFLLDDQQSTSSGADSPLPPAPIEPSISPALEPTLSVPLSPSQSVSLSSPNVNKDVPPPPTETDSDESEAPDLYLSGLILPSMFLPIPNVRRFPSFNSLTWWLSRSLIYYNCIRQIP